MARPDVRGGACGEMLLPPAALVEGQAEGADRLGHVALHQRDDTAGIDPAREERPERHVREEALANRVVEQRAELLDRVSGRLAPAGRLPVAALDHLLVAVDEAMTR